MSQKEEPLFLVKQKCKLQGGCCWEEEEEEAYLLAAPLLYSTTMEIFEFEPFQLFWFLHTEGFDFITSTESIESSRELGRVHQVSTDSMSVSYLVSVSMRLNLSRLRIGRVVPNSTDFLNPGVDGVWHVKVTCHVAVDIENGFFGADLMADGETQFVLDVGDYDLCTMFVKA